MPLKFKIYYWCCLLMILSAGFSLVLFVYILLTSRIFNHELIIVFITLLVLCFFVYKPIYSLTFLEHIKRNTASPNVHIKLFKSLNIALIVLVFFQAVNMTRANVFVYESLDTLQLTSGVASSSTFLLSIYFCFMDRVLIKYVERKSDHDIEHLGEDIIS